jgi:hypothetical protein
VTNLLKEKIANNSRQEHHSIVHLQMVWSVLGSWTLKLQDCTEHAESNFLMQACFILCNSYFDSCHAKVKHSRHTCPKAFNMQSECQFMDFRNTIRTEKKQRIIFS